MNKTRVKTTYAKHKTSIPNLLDGKWGETINMHNYEPK